jgi:hypothetical protein
MKPHIDKLLARIVRKEEAYDYKNDPDNRLE